MSTASTYILDTNAISEYRKLNNNKAHPNFIQWQRNINLNDLYLTTITIMELNIGVLRLAKKDKPQSKQLHHKIIPAFRGRILEFDIHSALICSELQVPDPRSERDAMIAAIAIANNHQVVTRNIKDFALMNINDKLINPFD